MASDAVADISERMPTASVAEIRTLSEFVAGGVAA